MRFGTLGFLMLLAACGGREPAPRPQHVDLPPVPQSPLAAKTFDYSALVPGETMVFAGGQFRARDRIEEGKDLDPALTKRVLDGVFPRYLKRVCPKVPGEDRAKSWVDLDRMQADAERAGLFRPRILQRIDGHFTLTNAHRDRLETLFTIDYGHCVNNGGIQTLYVVFETRTLADEKPAPILKIRSSEWHAHTLVGVVERDGLDVLLARSCCDERNDKVYTLRIDIDEEKIWRLSGGASIDFDRRCSLVLGAPNRPITLHRLWCGD